MREVNLIGGFYRDAPWSAEDTVNWIPVPARAEGTRSPIKLKGLPGLGAMNPPVVVIVPVSISGNSPDVLVGSAYSFQYTAAGGTPGYTFSIISGSLPAGLSMSSAGLITGTPTTAQVSSFRVLVTDSEGLSAFLDDTIRISLSFDTWALLHFDGNFDDDTGKVWTSFGSPTTGTPARFGSASSSYAGGGNGVRSPITLAYPSGEIGSSVGDWTAEFWVYLPENITTYQPILHIDGDSPSGAISLRISQPGSATNELYFGTTSGSGSPVGYVVPLTQWVHVAISRQGTETRLFCDGVLVDPGTRPANAATNAAIYLGRIDRFFGSSQGFDGRIDEFRFILGAALYTSNFTPPAAPFTL